jgi:glycosyltransferase involved in cell wall biosynthesis
MKTFMLGWEFPPFISGGLGTACYGLTKAMDKLGINVVFVLPKSCAEHQSGSVKIISAEDFPGSGVFGGFKNVRFRTIVSPLKPYANAGSYQRFISSKFSKMNKGSNVNPAQIKDMSNYGGDMYSEVCRYADKAAKIAATEEFDIIHAHDWMTYPAGVVVSKLSGKPLVVHVHSTEFDRSGENINQMIYDIEWQGMHAAEKVIAVSNYTKNIIIRHYGIPSEKVEVIYNAVEYEDSKVAEAVPAKSGKIVLFLGRITMQKGPEYFLAAAKKVLEVINNVKFIMAGDGDMKHRIINLAAQLGIGHKVLFTGFLRGADVDRVYQMADLYVMPSVSEPFGIAPLEAMRRNVPVLISKHSGISEVLLHALKVDFWDINEMANKIVAVLKRPPLQMTLSKNGFSETHKFRWEDSALKVKRVYEATLASVGIN